MSQAITLWGAGTTRTLRPIWVAEELNISYVLRPIGPRTGETQTAEFTRLSSKQKIPVLVDGSLHLSESLAICRYLISSYSSTVMAMPSTPAQRALEDEWCCYIYGELDETSLYVMRRHGDLAAIYGASPDVVAASADYAARHLAIIAKRLRGCEFVMEFGFGLADVLLTTCLIWAQAYEIELPHELEDYLSRIKQRPGFQRAALVNSNAAANGA